MSLNLKKNNNGFGTCAVIRTELSKKQNKKHIKHNLSDNDSLSFRSITKIAAIHNPHTTQKMTNRKQVVCRVVDHNYV